MKVVITLFFIILDEILHAKIARTDKRFLIHPVYHVDFLTLNLSTLIVIIIKIMLLLQKKNVLPFHRRNMMYYIIDQ